jgi:hypothetical protein
MAFSSQRSITAGARQDVHAAHSRQLLAMPALPGATISRSHFGFCRTAQASACSRPPPPRIRMFMRAPPLPSVSRAF